jgi:hypothetical protein
MTEHSSLQRFKWTTYDVNSLLHEGWQQEIIDVAKSFRSRKSLFPPHSTSRESHDIQELPILTVRGQTVWETLPWLVELYRTTFLELGQACSNETLSPTIDTRYAVVVNVQENDGTRYECHVDTNPFEGLLYVTSHPQGCGGELVIANSVSASNVTAVDDDCSILYPQSGHLVFFDGRFHPHYVRRLLSGEIRVAVGMNYYLPSWPESTRPSDLNIYLYGHH